MGFGNSSPPPQAGGYAFSLRIVGGRWRFVRQLLCLVTLLALTSGMAQAQSWDATTYQMGLGEAQSICRSANTGAWQGGVALAQPGRWWNPKRYGTGWDLVYSDDRKQLKVFLYTYNRHGQPVWLTTAMKAIDPSGDGWRADLIEYTKDATSGAIDNGTDVGDVYFRFFRDDPSRMAMRWRWKEVTDTQANAPDYSDECLNDLTRLNPTYYTGAADAAETRQLFDAVVTPGLNQTFSGYWSTVENVDKVPGVVMTIMQTSLGTQADKLGEAAVWLTFNEIADGQKKRPVFMQAQRTDLRSSLPFETDSFDLYFHYATGYPHGVPTTDCTSTTACVSNVRIGTYERTFRADSNYRRALVKYTLQGNTDSGGFLTVPNPGYLGTPPSGSRPAVKLPPYPSSSTTLIHRTTRLQDISVNRYVCAVGAELGSTCDIFVSWSGNGIGKPWKRDLGTLRYDAQPISTEEVGIAPVAMKAGDRFQLELWSGVPGAPGAVMLDKAPEIRGMLFGSASTASITVPAAEPISNRDDLGTHDPSIGAVAGTADVSGGAATYSVPIAVPPGRNGMQPSLSLSYSSRAGNGVAGLGWSLSAGSSIHRCPQTLAQDGNVRGVRLDANDRLCLDGQRLLTAPNSVGYGSANASYRTEVESFARVTQAGTLDSATGCFTVEQKDGRTLTYGCIPPGQQGCAASVAPRVQLLPGNATLSWQLSRVEDRSGNTMEYCYRHGADSSELLLERIVYTGSTKPGFPAPKRSVRFVYDARPHGERANDRSASWFAGRIMQQTLRLTDITTHAPDATGPDQTHKRYRLDYADVATTGLDYSYTSGRSLLRRIHECAYDGAAPVCLTPTEFGWTDGTWLFRSQKLSVSATPASTPSPDGDTPAWTDGEDEAHAPVYRRRSARPIGDLDGDGTREMLVGTSWYDGQGWRYRAQLAKVTADRAVQGAVTLDGFWLSQSADLDGDGIAELLNDSKIYKWKRGRGAAACDGGAATCTAPAIAYFQEVGTNLPAAANDAIQSIADFNGDGAPDVLMRLGVGATCGFGRAQESVDPPSGSAPLCLYLNAKPGPIVPETARFNFASVQPVDNLSSIGTNGDVVQHVADLDGNGATDVVIADTAGIKHIRFGQLSGGVLTFSSGLPADLSLRSYTRNVRWMDVNADGLDDIVMADVPGGSTTNCSGSQCFAVWVLQLNKGDRTFTSSIYPASAPGTVSPGLAIDRVKSQWQLRYFSKMIQADIDTDGRPDLLYPAHFAARMCFGAKLSPGMFLQPRPDPEKCTDLGVNSGVCEAHVCAAPPPEDGTAYAAHPGGGALFSADAYKSGLGEFDPSVYRYNAIRFVQTGPDTFRLQVDETPIVAGASSLGNQRGHADDYFGDGLADVSADAGCPLLPTARFPGNACQLVTGSGIGPGSATSWLDAAQTITLGQLVSPATISVVLNENLGDGARSGLAPVFPDLMNTAVNALNERAQWDYFPLSSSAGRNGADFPLYRIDGNYVDRRHYLFQSSMPVVSQLARSHAASGGTSGLPASGGRSQRYTYGGAMYNSEGRGFQGFRTIGSETFGAFERTLRTVTTFHQKFPLTGRVERVETRVPHVAGANGVIALETLSWGCDRSNRDLACPGQDSSPLVPGTIFWPYLGRSIKATFDLTQAEAGALPRPASTTTTLNGNPAGAASGWDPYGNLTYQTVTVQDGAGAADGERFYLASHVTTTINAYDDAPERIGEWWLDRLTTNLTQTTVSYHARTLPDGASLSPKKVLRQPEWNADRTLLAQTVTDPFTGTTLRTAYTYPALNAGLPASVTVSGSGITPQRETRTTYSTDGYFPLSITTVLDPATSSANHTATTQVRAVDGRPVLTTDPNGVTTEYRYDPFGRLIHSQARGNDGRALAPPTETSLRRCNVVTPCTAPDEGYAAYYQSTVADGAPSQRVWFDLLGREVKRATRGFDGRWVNVATRYDTGGTVRETSAPYFSAETPLFTQLSYDRLGRTTTRRAPVAELDPAQGDVVTTYAYDALETTIAVRPVNAAACNARPNLCLTMSRQHNALGQLMRTTDAHNGRTDYWFDPLGQAAALRDANGKATVARYNGFGHRLESHDPNQGIWTFTYNGLGELLTQTDARQVKTTVQRDALGRMRQQLREPPTIVPAGLANEKTRDTWEYDSAGIKGQLASVQRESTSADGTFPGTPVWRESYGYWLDSGRLQSRTTTSQGGPLQALTTSYQYDGHYGHLSGVTYPNTPQPLTVWKRYTRYGALSGLVDARMMTPLWSMTQADAYGKPTQEQFGYALTATASYSRSTGQMLSQGWQPFDRPTSPGEVETLGYGYDVLGNLVSQERKWRRYDAPRGSSNALLGTNTTNYLGGSKEIYRYDGLQRLLSVDRLTGTSTAEANPFPYLLTASLAYQYDAVGNITSKSDFANTYIYGTAATPAEVGAGATATQGGACGPNALLRTVNSTDNLTRDYRCDRNGNQIGETLSGANAGSRAIVFDGANLPTAIDHVDPQNTLSFGGHVDYRYGPDNARYRRTERAGLSTPIVIHYGSDGYEQQINTGNPVQTLHRIDLGPVLYTRNVVGSTAQAAEVAYQLRDRLGSTIAIADRWGDFNGTESAINLAHGEGLLRRFYDPFGAPTKPDFGGTAQQPELRWHALSPKTWRGFTGHEHIDGARLIHMNGRTFDYRSGRFLSVDPLIQAPANSQSLNPYSYVFNNPLSGVDPSGYASVDAGSVCARGAGVCGQLLGKDGISALSAMTVDRPTLGEQTQGALDRTAATSVGVLRNGADTQGVNGAGGAANQQAEAADKGAQATTGAPQTDGVHRATPPSISDYVQAAVPYIPRGSEYAGALASLAELYTAAKGAATGDGNNPYTGEYMSREQRSQAVAQNIFFAMIGMAGRGGAIRSVVSGSTDAAFGGGLYSPDKLRLLVSYLERRGISVYGTSGNPRFTARSDGSGMMELPGNPTVLQVKHELSHYLDFRNFGYDAYKDMGRLAREVSVLDRLKSNRSWSDFNEAERNFSINYVERLKQ